MRLRLYSNAILTCSNASISSSHVNGCEVVVFVCCEASIATPHRLSSPNTFLIFVILDFKKMKLVVVVVVVVVEIAVNEISH